MNSCVSFLRFCDGALDSRIAEAEGDPDVPPFPRPPRSYPASGRSFLEQVNASPLTDRDGAAPSAAAAATSEATLSLASRLEELLAATSTSGAAGLVGRDADPSSAVSFHQHISKWYALRRLTEMYESLIDASATRTRGSVGCTSRRGRGGRALGEGRAASGLVRGGGGTMGDTIDDKGGGEGNAAGERRNKDGSDTYTEGGETESDAVLGGPSSELHRLFMERLGHRLGHGIIHGIDVGKGDTGDEGGRDRFREEGRADSNAHTDKQTTNGRGFGSEGDHTSNGGRYNASFAVDAATVLRIVGLQRHRPHQSMPPAKDGSAQGASRGDKRATRAPPHPSRQKNTADHRTGNTAGRTTGAGARRSAGMVAAGRRGGQGATAGATSATVAMRVARVQNLQREALCVAIQVHIMDLAVGLKRQTTRLNKGGSRSLLGGGGTRDDLTLLRALDSIMSSVSSVSSTVSSGTRVSSGGRKGSFPSFMRRPNLAGRGAPARAAVATTTVNQ